MSVGPAIAQAALAITQKAARELLEQGTSLELERRLPFDVAYGMFAGS